MHELMALLSISIVLSIFVSLDPQTVLVLFILLTYYSTKTCSSSFMLEHYTLPSIPDSLCHSRGVVTSAYLGNKFTTLHSMHGFGLWLQVDKHSGY